MVAANLPTCFVFFLTNPFVIILVLPKRPMYESFKLINGHVYFTGLGNDSGNLRTSNYLGLLRAKVSASCFAKLRRPLSEELNLKSAGTPIPVVSPPP